MYRWKSEKTRLLRILRASRAEKIRRGWSRASGAGFISEDIESVKLNEGKTITIRFGSGHMQDFKASDLNLREIEELIKWLEKSEP
jgi:hypothetical protein